MNKRFPQEWLPREDSSANGLWEGTKGEEGRGLWSPGGEGAGWGIDPPAPTVVSWVVDVPTLPAGTLQAQGDPGTEKPGSGTRSLGWHQQVPKGCGQDISSWLGTGLFVFCLLRQTRIKPTVQGGAGGPKAGGDPGVHGGWMDMPRRYIHTMECYSALKRKEILTHRTKWVSLEHSMLSEISQSQKDEFCRILV